METLQGNMPTAALVRFTFVFRRSKRGVLHILRCGAGEIRTGQHTGHAAFHEPGRTRPVLFKGIDCCLHVTCAPRWFPCTKTAAGLWQLAGVTVVRPSARDAMLAANHPGGVRPPVRLAPCVLPRSRPRKSRLPHLPPPCAPCVRWRPARERPPSGVQMRNA